MNNIFKISLILLTLSGCATKELSTDLGKVKSRERIYTGKLDLNLNSQKNNETKCDVFLTSSFNADFKIPSDGFIVYKTTSKKSAISKIACPLKFKKDVIWVYHDLNLNPIEKTKTNKEIIYFGNINIKWEVTEKDINSWKNNLAKTGTIIENIGNFQLNISSDYEGFVSEATDKITQLKKEETKYSLVSQVFTREQDTIDKEKDAAEEDNDDDSSEE